MKNALAPLSLRDALNELSLHPERIEERRKAPRAGAAARALPCPAEIERFMAIDPLTATLYKRCVDARAQYLAALGAAAGGAGDAMSDVAADLAESAWTALETRIHELRADPAAHARAEALGALESRDRARRKRAQARQDEILAAQTRRRAQDRRRREENAGDRFYWSWLLWIYTQFHTGHNGFTGLPLVHIFEARAAAP